MIGAKSVSAHDTGAFAPSKLERHLPALILLSGIGVFVLNFWRNRFFLHDDAYISLKYAQNFVETGELTWNLGERVEGYTNFLYVILTSGLLRLGVDAVDALRILNGLAIILMAGAVYYAARNIAPERKELHALSITLAIGNVSAVVWFFGGLEAPVAAALIAWGMAFVVAAMLAETSARQISLFVAAGIALALTVLTRPDGVIVVACASIALLFTSSGDWKTRLRNAAIVGGIPFVVFMVHMVWRISYYGDIVPNTFHAKVGLDLSHRIGKLADYLLKSALLYLPVISCAGAAVAAAIIWGRLSRIAITMLIIAVGFTLYIAWSGGDHMAAARVFLPITGVLTLLAILAVNSLKEGAGRVVSLILVAMICVAALNARAFRMDWAAFNGTIVGRYIEQNWPAGSLVALNTAGSTPFFGASHRYIDMLGLNDRTIALREDVPILARRQAMPGHGKGDGAYVLSRQPDYIILGGSEGIDIADAAKWFLTGVELSSTDTFAACYTKNTVTLPVPEDLQASRPEKNELLFTYYERSCAD
ncbi:hypothetical protein [Loktanella sp. S4079]|uniref:hypothetical protein n=1 Tax=Loktanella sp. S4079 TaxID=579483 RepID=UPI000AC9C1F0|nr:hypothetical protein [Loktanella sp. S4079]